jgi:hypothetical protein
VQVATLAIMNADDDHSWDLIKLDEGNLPADEDAFDRKYEEWEKRDWMPWLSENLMFPLQVTRQEDDDDAYFEKRAAKAPFRLGHTMEIVGLEREDANAGIIVRAREQGKTGSVPLCDLKVKPEIDQNYWPVREYVVWFANR